MPGILKRFFGGRSSRWLLHGSPKKVARALVPRQPKCSVSCPEFSRRGLYATDHVVLAVLYALLGSHGNRWGWMMEAGQTSPIKVVVNGRLAIRPGHLYVVSKQSFRRVSARTVWRSVRPVVPVAREVVPAHLLRGLEKVGVIHIEKTRAA